MLCCFPTDDGEEDEYEACGPVDVEVGHVGNRGGHGGAGEGGEDQEDQGEEARKDAERGVASERERAS